MSIGEMPSGEVSARTRELSSFFNRLVEMIPARFYRDEEDRIDMYSLKKADKLAAKAELKAKAKQAKLVKLGGEPAPEASDVDDEDDEEQEEEEEAAAAGPGSAKTTAPLLNIPSENQSRNQLQEKLQLRLIVRIHAA